VDDITLDKLDKQPDIVDDIKTSVDKEGVVLNVYV
jgi:hypothetical protein